MKTIGVVGGLAWPSTITYYEIINDEITKRLGGSHCADMVLAQTDFEEVVNNQDKGNWDRVGEILAGSVNRLESAGADFYIIACNTVHIAMDKIEELTDLPYIHIVDPTAEYLVENGFTKVGLMGSGHTLEKDYFKGRLRDRYGLEVILPEGAHRNNIHNALYSELVNGIFKEETKEKYMAAIDDLAARGAQAVILGCTEFGLAVDADKSPVPIVDTVRLHALAAVEKALG